MMCDSHAHDRELQVKWCVNCHSIVLIQHRAVEGFELKLDEYGIAKNWIMIKKD